MVSTQDKDAMKNILSALNGNKQALKSNRSSTVDYDDLGGPGVVSEAAKNAMADILTKLNDVSNQIVTDSRFNPQLNEAIHTQRTNTGVKVGNYEILIKEDQSRIAGKQYYGIYHVKSGDIIASDITLYEIAISAVKYLNNGKYVNSSMIRNLFEIDDRYTSHKTDAIRFKGKSKSLEKSGDFRKSEVYESRYQSSIAAAATAKQDIKRLLTEYRNKKR